MARAFIPMRNDFNSLFHIKLQGGGRLPEALKGQYTSEQVALNSINVYLEGMRNATRRNQSSKA